MSCCKDGNMDMPKRKGRELSSVETVAASSSNTIRAWHVSYEFVSPLTVRFDCSPTFALGGERISPLAVWTPDVDDGVRNRVAAFVEDPSRNGKLDRPNINQPTGDDTRGQNHLPVIFSSAYLYVPCATTIIEKAVIGEIEWPPGEVWSEAAFARLAHDCGPNNSSCRCRGS